MNRRTALGLAGGGLLAGPGPLAAAQVAARRGMPALKITDLKVILTQPGPDHLVIVKLLTSEPGLYGVGCATHRERPYAVAAALEKHLREFVIGKNCDEIEDIWQSAYVASYFRSGVTLNNALSGIDGALWDILGKRLGAPVYQLLGGKVRAAVPLYAHSSGRDFQEVEDQTRKWMAGGYRHVRMQVATPGFSGYGARGETSKTVESMRPSGVAPSPVFEPTPYVNNTIKMFDYMRSKLGFEVELLHDVHERVPPAQALLLARAWSRSASSFSKIPSLRRTCNGFRSCANRPPHLLPWANFSSIAMNGCRWWPTAGSISCAFTFPPSAA